MDQQSCNAYGVKTSKSEDSLFDNITKPKYDITWRRRNSFNLSLNEFKIKSNVDDKDLDYLKYELLWSTHINQRHPTQFRRMKNFNANMRSILIDWMMEICSVYRMQRNTFHLAMDYLDRYIGRVETVPSNRLQLLGITCIFIAAKLMEVSPPLTTELASLTDGACEATDIKTFEIEILSKLQWDMLPNTLNFWLYRYLSRWADLIQYRNSIAFFPKLWNYLFIKASLIIDLCSLDKEIVLYPYSFIVAAILYHILSPEKAYYVSGLTYEQLESCLSWLTPFIAIANQELLLIFFRSDNDQPLENIQITTDPNVEFVESYTIQTHYVDPVVLHDVYNFRDFQENQNLEAKRE
ncbi:Cyclin E [Carabus blaptoides fortunei]